MKPIISSRGARPQGQEPDAGIAGLAATFFPCHHVKLTLFFDLRETGHEM
jgi:hypothetical protein